MLDELYTASPDEFIATRDALVANARKAGDRDVALALSRLRRPTVGAWLVNLLVRRRPELIDELFGLGDQLREAQKAASGSALRELSQQRRAVVAALAAQAKSLAAQAGRRQVLPLAEVESTLMAALGDPVAADEVRVGMLTHPLTPGGFTGEANRPSLTVIRGGKASASPPRPAEVDSAQREATRKRVASAEQELTEAQAVAAREASRHEAAGEAADELTAAIEAAQQRVDSALATLNHAQAELAEIRGRANAAQKELADAAARAGRAHLHELAARRELDAARASLR